MQRRYAYAFAVAALLLALVGLRSRRRIQKRDARFAASWEAPPNGLSERESERSPAQPPNVILESFEEARAIPDGVAILRGDGGRWVYATVPAAHLACDDVTLIALLFALDARACDRPEVATIAFEVAPVGSHVAAEFGQAPIVDGLWLHPNFAKRGFSPHVADVIANRRSLDDALGRFPRRKASDDA
jgi:hypothetical protein